MATEQMAVCTWCWTPRGVEGLWGDYNYFPLATEDPVRCLWCHGVGVGAGALGDSAAWKNNAFYAELPLPVKADPAWSDGFLAEYGPEAP